MRAGVPLAAAWLLAAGPVLAQVDVATVHYRPGDLVFIEGTGAEAAALKALTDSRYTEVGLIRETGGGPYVLFASPEFGTDEMPLDEFLARGVEGQYALYRPAEQASGGGLNPRTVRVAYDDFYLAPYDPFYLAEGEALYGAQMIRDVFAAAGVTLAAERRLAERNADAPAVRWYFMVEWRSRPDCAQMDEAACWAHIKTLDIVTPADLAADPQLTLVENTFKPAGD